MNVNHQELPVDTIGQSPGYDPKTSKRNSGLFSFLRWFKPSTSRESVNTDLQNSHSSSCDSLTSLQSNGTVASFSFVHPSAYKQVPQEKYIFPGPETDTYKARLKQREKRRENDRNLTLRKKYNLFFNRETLLKPAPTLPSEEDNSKSLPLMTRKMDDVGEEKMHRRTASESSKVKRAGAYCHVKGKRKAPQPPGSVKLQDGHSTTSLRRKKRLAPPPPAVSHEQVINTLEYADADVIFNDSLKLDHGILKSTKEPDVVKTSSENKLSTNKSSSTETPVSPRPWYKRHSSRDSVSSSKKEHKYEPVERLPEVPYIRNSTVDLTVEEPKIDKKKEDKRKSGLSFLTNISELDRQASEIIKKEHQKNGNEIAEMPEFMRPKQLDSKMNTDSLATPKRKSAKDLIAKFNAITSVTKVTVNTAFFGTKDSSPAQKYFDKQTEKVKKFSNPENKLERFRKPSVSEEVKGNAPLMKSESASAIKPKPETPKIEKKSWFCPKCHLENDYWRIICYVCSTIKPYFDDLTTTPKTNAFEQKPTEIKPTAPDLTKNTNTPLKPISEFPGPLERSKTQIGFSVLTKYNDTTQNKKPAEKSSEAENKKEEREKLKKMLIEMKNSLPKRKPNGNSKPNNRASVIAENPETVEAAEAKEKPPSPAKEEEKEEKKIEVVVATKETIYENIKVKKTDNPKPIKVSSSAQTSSVVKKITPAPANITSALNKVTDDEPPKKQNNFELMRPKDFDNIYSDKTGKSSAHIYENLARNDDLSLFFNMPKRFSEIKREMNFAANNKDTLEINRLLRRLESSIAKGEMNEAALFAQELAQLKVNCSVIRQKSVEDANATPENKKSVFTVEMYVEDKISHRGPFPIQVHQNQTVRELKVQVEREFEIPVAVQRWILGKELATDDNATLKDVHVTTEGCPVFLYLVATSNDVKNSNSEAGPSTSTPTPAATASTSAATPSTSATAPPSPKPAEPIQTTGVKIVEEILKKDISTPLATPGPSKDPPKQPQKPELKKQEAIYNTDEEDYDSKTLKPQSAPQEWECTRCTLLNPLSSNVCAVCASIRTHRDKDQKNLTSKKVKRKAPQPANKNDQHYLQLINLDNADLVENVEAFECVVCYMEIAPGDGVTLRECLHQFCKQCLKNTIEYTEEAQVICPYRDEQYSCDTALQDREIKALVPTAVYDQYLAKSVAQAENKIDKSFHCKTPDCKGWCIFEDNVNEFKCPVCKKFNCLTCQAIHTGLNCKQYQERMKEESQIDENAKRTKEMLDEMVKKGDALTCPTCQVVLMKKWGCDWLRCSMCKTEICWVTKGPRWGPGGKGDTSGGCQCGVNGVKCHPQCNYCH